MKNAWLDVLDFLSFIASFVMNLAAALLVFAVLLAVIFFAQDRMQHKSALRRNFPLIARFRYVLEHVGEFFRQYFFAFDREEMPFNRAERSWVYRAAKGLSNTVPFGSTRNLKQPGDIVFANALFGVLEDDAEPLETIEIGPHCKNPYRQSSILNISGMSYGAISASAVSALSKGAKMAGCWMNTGEGGLSDHHLEGGADLVFQIGTAKFGVRTADGHLCDVRLREVAGIDQVKMFEIKISQGAKPGKGGMLPAAKITPAIAKARGIPVGKDSFSPNRHPELQTPDDLLDMVAHVKTVTEKPVGFKLVIGHPDDLKVLFERIAQRDTLDAPDFITLDSADGGTGAAPMPLIDHVGLPISASLPKLIDLLEYYGLRARIKVVVSGKLINPYGVAWALCMGADFVTSARGFMFALGCIQALKCHKNTCPTGITTHNPKLEKALDPSFKAVRVANYIKNIHAQVAMISHSCGFTQPRKMDRKAAYVVKDSGNFCTID